MRPLLRNASCLFERLLAEKGFSPAWPALLEEMHAMRHAPLACLTPAIQ